MSKVSHKIMKIEIKLKNNLKRIKVGNKIKELVKCSTAQITPPCIE